MFSKKRGGDNERTAVDKSAIKWKRFVRSEMKGGFGEMIKTNRQQDLL